MQQNTNNNSALGTPYDRNLVDLERRLFNESLDTTRRIHQAGYDDLMQIRNLTTETKPIGYKGLFKNISALNENDKNSLRDRELQENLHRYFIFPQQGNEFQPKSTSETINHIENINGPPSVNTSEPFLRTCDHHQGTSFAEKLQGSIKPLKSILRNAIFRPEINNNSDYLKSRQVSFETQNPLCPDNSSIFRCISSPRVPNQMEWSSQNCANDCNGNHPESIISTGMNSQYSSQMLNSNNTENEPIRYQFRNVNPYGTSEERSQTGYLNDPNYHSTSYKYGYYNEIPNRNDGLNNCNTFPRQVDLTLQQQQIPPNFQFNHQNSNPPNIMNRIITTPTNYDIDRKINYGIPTHDNLLQPRTQQRETIYLGKLQPGLNGTVHTSNPCYAIPADVAYFFPDRFELYLDAKLLIPERMKVIIVPEKVELYGCTEYTTADCKSLLEIIRVYDLPARVTPEKTVCVLNAEGILFISAAWEKSF